MAWELAGMAAVLITVAKPVRASARMVIPFDMVMDLVVIVNVCAAVGVGCLASNGRG